MFENRNNGAQSLLISTGLRKDARSRALKRVEEREHLRLELQAREYIRLCHEVADTLVKGYEDREAEEGGSERVELSRARVQSLKSAADISLRLLDRVLPPLKAVEVNDSPEKDLQDVSKMSTAELSALLRRQMIPLEGQFAPVEEGKEKKSKGPFG